MGPLPAQTPLPLAVLIPAGFNPERTLFIDGYVMNDAQWFCFSLQGGPSLRGADDVMFFFMVHIRNNITTFSLNSFLEGKWCDAAEHRWLCRTITKAQTTAATVESEPGTSAERTAILKKVESLKLMAQTLNLFHADDKIAKIENFEAAVLLDSEHQSTIMSSHLYGSDNENSNLKKEQSVEVPNGSNTNVNSKPEEEATIDSKDKKSVSIQDFGTYRNNETMTFSNQRADAETITRGIATIQGKDQSVETNSPEETLRVHINENQLIESSNLNENSTIIEKRMSNQSANNTDNDVRRTLKEEEIKDSNKTQTTLGDLSSYSREDLLTVTLKAVSNRTENNIDISNDQLNTKESLDSNENETVVKLENWLRRSSDAIKELLNQYSGTNKAGTHQRNQTNAENSTNDTKIQRSNSNFIIKLFKDIVAKLHQSSENVNKTNRTPPANNPKELFEKIVLSYKRNKALKVEPLLNEDERTNGTESQPEINLPDGERQDKVASKTREESRKENANANNIHRRMLRHNCDSLNVYATNRNTVQNQTIAETSDHHHRKALANLMNSLDAEMNKETSASTLLATIDNLPETLLQESFTHDELHELDLRPGDIFNFALECLENGYLLTLNEELICVYPHLVDFKRVSHLAVAGDVRLEEIEVGGGMGPARHLLKELEEELEWSKDVLVITDENFARLVLGSAAMWVLCAYAAWCPACLHYRPHWEKVAETLAKHDVKVGVVDGDRNEQLMDDMKIPQYPSIVCFPKGTKNLKRILVYKGNRNSVEDWVLFILSGGTQLPLHLKEWLQPTTARKPQCPLQRRGYQPGGAGYDAQVAELQNLMSHSPQALELELRTSNKWHEDSCEEASARHVNGDLVHCAGTVVPTRATNVVINRKKSSCTTM